MGLDMYISDKDHQQIAYWRKHPDLHGFIVNMFAGGIDDCSRVWINAECVKIIISAVNQNRLPKTTGTFFGYSDSPFQGDTIEKLQNVLAYLERIIKRAGDADFRAYTFPL